MIAIESDFRFWPVSTDRGARRHVGNRVMNGLTADIAQLTFVTHFGSGACVAVVGAELAR